MSNHTYKVEHSGQVSIQNEARLKPYWASLDAVKEAPPLIELRRQTATRGQRRHGPEYKVVVLQDRDLVRDEQPPPPPEARPPSPAPVSSLPGPDLGLELETPIVEEGSIPEDVGEARAGPPTLAAPPVELTSPPVEAPIFLEGSQRSRQPLSYLQDFVCDCVQNGRSTSQAVGSAGSCHIQRGSCALKKESDFFKRAKQWA